MTARTPRFGPDENEVISVLMLPDHRRAYEAWLREHGLVIGCIPFTASSGDIATYVVTPAYDHPRGKRS